MYDLAIVGAGITAATLVAQLKDRLRICVIESRNHIGGNCFDYQSQGSFIHRYGPHIFHSPSPRIVSFLERFTEWVPYSHKVVAEIQEGLELRYVPFPYCRQTAQSLGRELTEPEIVDKFFRGYSEKQWGTSWDGLPSSIRGRVPKDTFDEPVYYRDHFVALPRFGYSRMIENMLDGAEVILGAPALEWTRVPAQVIVYTGRPDLVPLPGESATIAENEGLQLDFRTLDIRFASEEWIGNAACLHACSLERTWTRKTRFARLTGGQSDLVSTEFPRQATCDDLTPFYPVEIEQNQQRFQQLSARVHQCYPDLHLAGRLGSYRYFDMYQAVGQAIALAERLWKK